MTIETVGGQTLYHGDNRDVLSRLPANTYDFGVEDPPYGLGTVTDLPALLKDWMGGGDGREFARGGFMNKGWDSTVPAPAEFKEQFRVLKPGAHLLLFCGTRNFDLMSLSARLAGFEVRDGIPCHGLIAYVYGSGFPAGSKDASKALDEAAGRDREVVGRKAGVTGENLNDLVRDPDAAPRDASEDGGRGVGAYGVGAKQTKITLDVTAPASGEAARFEGYGTLLKSSSELVLVLRKPIEGVWCSELRGLTGWDRWHTKYRDADWMGRPDDPAYEKSRCAKLCAAWLGIPFERDLGDGRVKRWVVERNWIALHAGEVSASSVGFAGRAQNSMPLVEVYGQKNYADRRIVNLAANLLKWGTGCLNIDGCRVGGDPWRPQTGHNWKPGHGGYLASAQDDRPDATSERDPDRLQSCHPAGRWPPNTVFVHAPTCRRSAGSPTKRGRSRPAGNSHDGVRLQNSGAKNQFSYEESPGEWECDAGECLVWQLSVQGGGGRRSGSAADFFPGLQTSEADIDAFFRYQAKASKTEKNAGLSDLPSGTLNRTNPGGMENDPRWAPQETKNTHVTVKPVSLMEWLIKLACPPRTEGYEPVGLDAYMGSGTTNVAAEGLGVKMDGIELEDRSFEIALGRVRHAAERASFGPSPVREGVAEAQFAEAIGEWNGRIVRDALGEPDAKFLPWDVDLSRPIGTGSFDGDTLTVEFNGSSEAREMMRVLGVLEESNAERHGG